MSGNQRRRRKIQEAQREYRGSRKKPYDKALKNRKIRNTMSGHGAHEKGGCLGRLSLVVKLVRAVATLMR
jgi:hypothetical protein